MFTPFKVRIYTAEDVFYEGECESLILPTVDGKMGIMANHDDLIAAVSSGDMQYTVKGEKRYAAVSEGLVKIESGDVLVLVDTAEKPEDIDANRAKIAAMKAKEKMLHQQSDEEYRSAETDLERELSRLNTIAKFNKNKI